MRRKKKMTKRLVSKEEAEQVLERHPELRKKANVLNAAVATKWKDGVDTGEVSIVAYVIEKKELKVLKKVDRLPSEIEGVPVDVIVLGNEDFALVDTPPSMLPPKVQRRIAGGVRK
jgi:predicted transcriptional regulator